MGPMSGEEVLEELVDGPRQRSSRNLEYYSSLDTSEVAA